jgi:tRNA(Ile2) C34 agmatinyltransferase TiaS
VKHDKLASPSRDADLRGERATRVCLYCGREFMSAHKGNRRCETCADKLAANTCDWGSIAGFPREMGWVAS